MNTPNCSSCYGCNCEAEYTTVTITNSGNVNTLLYPNQSYVHQGETYHIDITFHSGGASANPECTEEICFGPQSTSDFTFEIYRAGGKGEIAAQITAGADDGFAARTPEYFSADSKALTIGTDLKFDAFLRFPDLKISANATITKAYISVVPAVTNPAGPMVNISAADAANPSASTTSSDFYARKRTSSSVNWDASSWAAGESENSTDISSVIQELVDSYDYSAGAPILIFLDIAEEGTENQYFAAFEDAEYDAPKLYIEYYHKGCSGVDNIPPVVAIISPEEGVTYEATTVDLSYIVNEPTRWMGYSLDEAGNITISENRTLENLKN